ncbi:MAG: hypothetical protein GKR95_15255 [Gammaproteobacteria bacterium]|nr:hypothetical protein [Gammaproteobacteria bacterium]NKB63413.1 hypothetical protein [Gammaproteobacteria bacterium]
MTVKNKEMQHVVVELDIPDSVQVPDYYDWGEAQVAQMYRAGIMSGREAAETLDVPHRDIIDILSKYGVAAANIENYDLYMGNLNKE